MSGTTLPTGGGYAGQAWLQTGGRDYNGLDFMVRQIFAGKAFTALVLVVAVHGGGAGAPATVDVQPMVGQVDGLGNIVPHGVVYGLPCHRLQGGASAAIVDPVAGDIGLALMCDRDISKVKATGAVAGPGSRRQQDWADGCYLGAFLGQTPTTYIQIAPAGITLHTPGNLIIYAANAALDASGNFSCIGGVTAGAGTFDSVTLQHHKHGTGSPAAGTATPTGGT